MMFMWSHLVGVVRIYEEVHSSSFLRLPPGPGQRPYGQMQYVDSDSTAPKVKVDGHINTHTMNEHNQETLDVV